MERDSKCTSSSSGLEPPCILLMASLSSFEIRREEHRDWARHMQASSEEGSIVAM